MCADWVRTQGDRVHSIYAQLTNNNGSLNIPAGTAVVFHGRDHSQTDATLPAIGGPGVILRPDAISDDPSRGFVRYDLNDTDVANPGIYQCQWHLTPPNYPFHQSFPEDSYMILIVLPKA